MTFRAASSPRAVADALPPPDEARVRNVLAAAGADLPQALATLSAAIGAIVAERMPEMVRPLLLGSVAHLMTRSALLRGSDPEGRA